ncbi:MAG: C-type lectin domain-containing protein [Lentisphaerota bacterium]
MKLMLALMMLTLPMLSVLAQASSPLAALKTQYKAASSLLESEARGSYASALAVSGKNFRQAGDVDGVVAVEAELIRLGKGGILDAGITNAYAGVSSVAMNSVQGRDKKLGVLMDQYLAKLDAAVKSSLQANKIEDAKLAKSELERVRLLKSDIDSRMAMQGGEASDPKVAPTVPDPPKKTAPADSVEFKGHHYKHVPEIVTWDAANMQCNRMGGHLVTIADAEENIFVMNLGGVWDKWIGLRKTGGKFAWIDKSPLNYANWGPGQPDAAKEKGKMEAENAVAMAGKRENQYYGWTQQWPGRWNDLLGSKTNPDVKGYVCEWDY